MIEAVGNCVSYPVELALKPVYWVTDKVKELAKNFFGYILKIITFQLGAMDLPGAYWIMKFFQKVTSDPKEMPIDETRLNRSKALMLEYGGQEFTLHPEDGNAEIKAITLKSEDFFNKFYEKGAQLIEIRHEGRLRKALINAPMGDAAKFYLPKIPINLLDGRQVSGILLPEAPAVDDKPHILHSHSPGRSMCMDRRFVGLHLAAGYDVTIWDPRGTMESTGTASEGGYYLDIEAVYQHVKDHYQADPSRIYASGYCEGAAIAAHLKRKYHHEGLHYIASNPYTSMKDVVDGYGFLGRLANRLGALDNLKDPSLNVEQDGFDNVRKLRNLPHSNGKAIFLHTDTDHMMPRGSVSKLCDSFGYAGDPFEILRRHPNPEENGHMEPPYQDPAVWRRYVRLVT